MIPGVSTALSGLMASSKRLEVSASNTANLRTTGAVPGNAGPEAYQPLQPVQSSIAGGGTITGARPISPAYLPAYEPDSSFTDAAGMVAVPNVDPAAETVAQISAKHAYLFNLKTIGAADAMTKSLLDLKT